MGARRMSRKSRQSDASSRTLRNPYTVDALDDYEIGARLGQGAYGVVSKCTHLETKVQRALKSISKKKVPDQKKIWAEIESMNLLDHPNIVKVHESFEDSKTIYMVLDLCDGGELLDLVRTCSCGLEEVRVIHFTRQIADAVRHMHACGVAHRDLKLDNLLLQDGHVKVTDFGLSSRFEAGQVMQTMACTPQYVAPEVIRGLYTEACDVWSLGVIVYMLLSGKAPFSGETDAQVLSSVAIGAFDCEGSHWLSVSNGAKGLVMRILVAEALRPSAAVVLCDPWLCEES